MKKIKLYVVALVAVVLGATTLAPVAVGAVYNPLDTVCTSNPDSEVCKNKDDGAQNLIQNLVNTLLYVVGALSVIMIIVAGILYTTSAGDSNKVSRAKNTLNYSITGLVVAVLAYAIVNWVLTIF